MASYWHTIGWMWKIPIWRFPETGLPLVIIHRFKNHYSWNFQSTSYSIGVAPWLWKRQKCETSTKIIIFPCWGQPPRILQHFQGGSVIRLLCQSSQQGVDTGHVWLNVHLEQRGPWDRGQTAIGSISCVFLFFWIKYNYNIITSILFHFLGGYKVWSHAGRPAYVLCSWHVFLNPAVGSIKGAPHQSTFQALLRGPQVYINWEIRGKNRCS